MGDGHGREHVLQTVVELANSGPEASGEESLGDLDELRKFIAEREVTEVRVPAAQDLAELHDLRRKLYAVFAAADEEVVVQLTNEILALARIEPRLVRHADRPYHLHYFPTYASLTGHLAADCAMTLALLVADGEVSRLRVCEAADCSRAFVDFSRNQVRRYCDGQRCGNRLHAAAYRARQRKLRAP